MLGRITLALFFLLLVWGNLVAGLEAGLGCPDWPLCRGVVIPPLKFDVWMEFTHRLIAAVATVFLLLLCRRRLKGYGGMARVVPLAALGLVAVVITLGGITVIMELPAQITTVHFMTALALFLLVGYMAFFDGVNEQPRFSLKGYAGLFLGLAVLIYFQASLGAYVRHSDAGSACPDFPTCLGSWLPHLSGGVLVHYSHRLLAYLIIGTMAAIVAAVFIDAGLKRHRQKTFALLGLAVIQTGVGAGVVLSGLNFAATAFHLAVALIMLLVTGLIWAGEVKGESP
ncbi:MAG TPA: COX15/CtaA family protein [Geobacteraceae bacterium]|nr:COX15/CtaA family protein [Geobacteraceae bacterium]